MKRHLILIMLFSSLTAMAAPAAPVRAVTDTYFGTPVVDNYRYMENLKDPEVAAWMKAQADHTRATLDALPGRAALLNRMSELMQSTPAIVEDLQIVDGHYYTIRMPAGTQQPKLYVRKGVKGLDRLLIDPEKLAGGKDAHLALQYFRPSPDNRYVAYSLAAGGSEEGVLHILDSNTGEDLTESADRVKFGAPSWRADSQSFFYTRMRKLTPGMAVTARYQNLRVYLHILGQAFDNDTPILGHGLSDGSIPMTPEEMPWVVTRPDSPYALAMISPGTDPRNRAYVAPVTDIKNGRTRWRAVASSYDDQLMDPAMHGNSLYWLSRKNAPRGRLLELDLSRPDAKPRIVAAEGDLPISDVYAGHDALYWRISNAGINQVQRLAYTEGAKPETLHLPYPANVTDVITDKVGNAVVLNASSWIRSPAYLERNSTTGAIADSGLQPVGAYDNAKDLVVAEVKVKSWDGTRVPLSIVYRKGLALDGTHPAELSGYGAYGISQSPFFMPFFRAQYERGMVVATCHVRGGGELGETWHEAGRQATKPNTWKDFIACADYLVTHKYTSAQQLVGTGGSAGGILIGRAIEERPELFVGAVALVPMADALRSETTANGVPNIPEFGSVKTAAGFRALHAMSPYANVKDGVKYPAVLITTGINDPRVDAWEPAKLAARLQAASTSGKPVLLRVDYAAGHGGMGASIDQFLAQFADMISFELWQTGDPDFQPRKVSTD
jgi:prolyl oligopeptidase